MADGWQPLTPDEVTRLFRTADFPWWIAGGWALDLFVGRQSREHDDIDVGIFRVDQHRLRSLLHGWDVHVASAGRTRRWEGEPIRHPVNDLWVRRDGSQPWCLQVMLNDGAGDEWVYRRDDRFRMALASAVRSDGHRPYLAAHLQLLFKAKDPRPKDDADFRLVYPLLTHDERLWLADALTVLHPGHPWLATTRRRSTRSGLHRTPAGDS